MFLFYTSSKYLKSGCFLKFSGGTDWKHWPDMGWAETSLSLGLSDKFPEARINISEKKRPLADSICGEISQDPGVNNEEIVSTHMSISNYLSWWKCYQPITFDINTYTVHKVMVKTWGSLVLLRCWGTWKLYWLLFSDGSCKNVQPTIFLGGRHQLHNLSVDAKTKEDDKLWKLDLG